MVSSTIPIKDLLNKIKWDKRENPEEYAIYYFDRILNRLISIPYKKIKRLEGSFMVLDNEEETNIPLHRIKKVTKNNAVVWERK
ncbi:DUF504 domain-containing protein [Candidatus Woesearchaeota archaeon]|nr:DUF504 domain-containing protein [Candidatus Woesearchaeota archaeon]